MNTNFFEVINTNSIPVSILSFEAQTHYFLLGLSDTWPYALAVAGVWAVARALRYRSGSTYD